MSMVDAPAALLAAELSGRGGSAGASRAPLQPERARAEAPTADARAEQALAVRGGAAAVALCAALAGGCSSDDAERPASKGVRPEVAGTTAGLANCREWNAATVDQRMFRLRDLRGQLTAQSDPSERSVLSDERAYDVFQRWCKQD